MAIKGGQILHVTGGFVIDRIQTGGVTGINVNEDRLEELGNTIAIGTIRDIPDLTFEIESFDVTTELESILTGGINDEADATLFDLALNVPINVISPFKASGAQTVDGGVVIPYLSLESMSYAFSLGDPATQTATMRGDSVFYVPGSVYEETFDGDTTTGPFNFTDGPAFKSTIGGTEYFALSVTVDGIRQKNIIDYTDTATGVTFEAGSEPATGTDNIVLTYGSAVASTYAQGVHNVADPIGIRGRDTYISVDAGNNWLGVQSGNIDWSVSLERDEEFGNSFIVAQDFDIPDVSGSVSMKAADVNALFAQIQLVTGLTGTDIANATEDPPELDVEIITVDSAGATTKTWIVPDAKFTVPSLQGSVGSKLETDFSFVSATGILEVYKADD
jgi:hypothetical protein